MPDENIEEMTDNAIANADMLLAILESLSPSAAEMWLAVTIMTAKMQAVYPRDLTGYVAQIEEGAALCRKQMERQHESN